MHKRGFGVGVVEGIEVVVGVGVAVGTPVVVGVGTGVAVTAKTDSRLAL
jgi:hypothetical protein